MALGRKTWISIIVAVVLVCALAGIAVVGGLAYFVFSHMQTEFIASDSAADRFAQARQRFAGQQPLIEMRDDRIPVVHRPTEAMTAERTRPDLRALRTLVYDPHATKLVDVSIPFWLLRMAPSGRLRFLADNGFDFDPERLRLTVDDLDRTGPALLLDHQDRSGVRLLVWTE